MSTELYSSWLGLVLGIFGISQMFYGSNPAFFFFENFYIGAVTSYTTFILYSSLRSTSLDFISRGEIQMIIPVIIGALLFLRFTKFRWAARYPTSILTGLGLGITVGLGLKGQILALLTGIVGSFINPAAFPGGGGLPSVIVLFIMTATAGTYWLYSIKYSNIFHARGSPLYYYQRLGRVFMVLCFAYAISIGSVLSVNFLVTVVYRPIKSTLELLGVG